LAFAGRPTHDNDANRSIAVARLAPLFDADIRFVSLQRDLGADDRALLRRYPNVVDVADDLHDFTDTAALVAQLD
jgi:hypothetical protein